MNEVLALAYGAAALVSFLALVSYSPLDPSLNSAVSRAVPRNLIGRAGSYSADLLFQGLGLVAFLLPAALAAAAWKRARSEAVDSFAAKALGAGLLAFSLGAGLGLLPLAGLGWQWRGAIPPGGLVGRLLADGLIHLLNATGTLLLLVLSFLGAVYLLTAFSFAALQPWFQAHFAWWYAWRERRRARRAEREKARLEARLAKKREAVVAPMPAPKAEPPPITARSKPVPPASAPVMKAPEPEAEPPVSAPAPHAERRPAVVTKSGSYRLPSTSLLQEAEGHRALDEEDLKRLANVLRMKCQEFDVQGAVTQINPGPVVTTFEYKPEAGVKYSRITNLVDDLCLALEAESILIERIPGKSTVGIEVPNAHRETIYLREVLECPEFTASHSKLTLSLGKDINGRIRVADLNTMPHLLMAGATGTGKSVCINSMIVSMLYKATPEELRLILVDPKRLELGLYDGVPHLLVPVITEPKLAAHALRNAVREMERRLKLLAEKGVRNIEQYNRLFDKPRTLSLFGEDGSPAGEPERPIPYIVIIIDELADLMMVDSNNVEASITRLAQMARAVGIHLILATQRPSVDVITGLIKANFPARISFRVATKVDSRTILDSNGSEALLGRGDMLYLPAGSARLLRVHGPLVTEKEIGSLVEFWRAQSRPAYETQYLAPPPREDEDDLAEAGGEIEEGEDDPLFEEAVRVIVEAGKASTSILQRRLRLGYGRAARLLDMMERDGIIGPPDGSKPREVLKRPDWFAEVDSQLR